MPGGTQVHDWNPGIAPSGLFWTLAVPSSAISISDDRSARLNLQNVAMPDYHDFGNAISPSPTSIPGHISIDARWSGQGKKQKISDSTFGFEGRYVGATVQVSFTVSDDGAGVTYTSDADGQNTAAAGMGRERNGVFF